MDVVGDLPDLDAIGVAPARDLSSMSRVVTRVSEALGLTQARALHAMAKPLVGAVMPDVSLVELERIAAEGGARVVVTLQKEDGTALLLTDLI